MSRTSSLLLAGAVLAAALAPAAVAGAAPQGKADKAKAEHERIVAYWTPERMKAAKPRDFERLPDGSFRQVKPAKGANANKGGKPGGGGGGGLASYVPTTTGSSWTTADSTGGTVQARTGKVYFRMGAQGYVCSGTVVDDGSTTEEESIVLTAGHCVYDETDGGFATLWLFIPDFDRNANLNTQDCNAADTTYGCWTATALVAHEGFTEAGGFTTAATQHDFAFAVVGLGGSKNSALDNEVGGYRLTTVSSADRLSAFGYPAGRPYKGNDLTYCSGSLVVDPYNGYTGSNDNWGMACGMTGGSSGGPWITTKTTPSGDGLDIAGNGGSIGSLNSYGYSGVKYMFGPVFNSATEAVYNIAKDHPSEDTPVS